jgi:hypothetical protein
MRIVLPAPHRGVVAMVLTVAGIAAASGPVRAESFWQKLFGWGSSGSAEAPAERPVEPGARMSALGADPDAGSSFAEDRGSYRTVCVRMCDGFYFPISDNVRRARFYQDNRSCQRRCDGEARLFYYPAKGGTPETMVDLAGRRYRDLPTAFQYRKSLVAGCACKPAPWSPQEAARHQTYAMQAAHGVDPEEGVVDIVAERRRQALARAEREGSGPYYGEAQAAASSEEPITAPAPRPARARVAAPAPAAAPVDLSEAYEEGYDAGPPVDFYEHDPEGEAPPRFRFSGDGHEQHPLSPFAGAGAGAGAAAQSSWR